MILEIDDAGIGCPIGGIVIGGRKGRMFCYKEIPPEFFHDDRMNSIKIQNAVLKVVIGILDELGFKPKEDEIRICKADLFKEAKEWLDDKGYSWCNSKIQGHTQDLVEGAFDFHLIKLGVPRLLLKRLVAYKDYSLRLIRWAVLSEERKVLIKKCFNYWRREWSKVRIYVREDHLNRRSAFCIECGDVIREGKALIIKYETPSRTYYEYAHVSMSDKKWVSQNWLT